LCRRTSPIVFLTDEYIYKLKKPVNMGFLDYSTLEKRRVCCEDEVRLNRRLCADAYLGVVVVKAVDCGFGLDTSDGEVVDYAVKMRLLPQERLLAENAVGRETLTELTGRLAAFHGSSESSKHISTFGSRETVGGNWQENFDQTDQGKIKKSSLCLAQKA